MEGMKGEVCWYGGAGRRGNSLFGVWDLIRGLEFGVIRGRSNNCNCGHFLWWMVGVCSCSCHRSLRISSSSFSLCVYAPLHPLCTRFVSAHHCIYKRSQKGTVVYKSIRSTCCWWCWTPVLTFIFAFAFAFIFAFASEKKLVF